MSNILKKCKREELEEDVRKNVTLAFTYFVYCDIILRNRWQNSLNVLFSFVKKPIVWFFNATKLLLADWFSFSMCLTNPLKNFLQNIEISRPTDIWTIELLAQQSGVSRNSSSKIPNKQVCFKMWYGVVIWTQFDIETIQLFIYYQKIWFSEKDLKRDL